jgi:MFS family permease
MNPTTAVISHWFKARRGLAMGLMAVGSSFGGTIIPIMSRNLIPLIGYVIQLLFQDESHRILDFRGQCE